MAKPASAPALAQREIEGAGIRHLGRVLLRLPAADQLVVTGQALDRHERRNVLRRRASRS